MANVFQLVPMEIASERDSTYFDSLHANMNDELLDSLYDFQPLAANWKGFNIEVVRNDERADFFAIESGGRNTLVVSESAKVYFEPIFQGHVEFLQVQVSTNIAVSSRSFFVMHCIRCEEPKLGSKFVWHKGKIVSTIKLALAPSSRELTCFGLPSHLKQRQEIFVSPAVAKKINGLKLKGITLHKTELSVSTKRLPAKKKPHTSILPWQLDSKTRVLSEELMKTFIVHLETVAKNIMAMGGNATKVKLSDIASKLFTEELEKKAQVTLPNRLRQVIQTIGLRLDFAWYLEETDTFGPYREFSNGCGIWDLSRLPTIMRQFRKMENQLYRKMLPIWEVGNGDFVAIDLRGRKRSQPVVYLDHESMESTGPIRIASSFDEYVLGLVNLGCVDIQLLIKSMLLDEATGCIALSGPAVTDWRSILSGQLMRE